MKILLALFLYSLAGLCSTEEWQKRWWGTQRIVDKHQFYNSEMLIAEPVGSIQSLFGLVYYTKNFNVVKDCINFEIPTSGEVGNIFVTTTSVDQKCEDVIFTEKRNGTVRARSLSYKLTNDKLVLQYTDEKFRSKEVGFDFLNQKDKKPELFQSSTIRKYGRSSIILAQNIKNIKQPAPRGSEASDWHQKNLISCQKVSDDCEKSESTCDQCKFGYFEVQNGCPTGGPKFCGVDQCGNKGQPACRRGFLFQNGEMIKMDCRIDSSFGFCQKGLKIRCQGSLAICD